MFTICSVGFFVPLIIIIFCYSGILQKMYSADNKLHRIRSGLPQPRIAKFSKTRRRTYTLKNIIPKRRVTVLVANLIVSFVICWLPFHSWVRVLLNERLIQNQKHLMRLSGLELTAHTACRYIRDVTFCLAYLNSLMNPLLYSFLAYGFRNRFYKALQRVKRFIYNIRRRDNRKKSHGLDKSSVTNIGYDALLRVLTLKSC